LQPSDIADLDRRIGLAGIANVIAGNGGLPKVVVSAVEASGEMYLHGGHVTSWKPRDAKEVLYLSPNSQFQEGRAIRGGIPVCFPWFGDKADDPTAPAHGFVRTREWRLESIELSGRDVVVAMSIESDDDMRKWWPFDFRLICRASFGLQLKVELVVTNTGASRFSFEEALHAYFSVGDAETSFVRGLDATRFIDKTDNRVENTQSDDVRFSSETDRVYLDTAHELQLCEPSAERTLTVQKENSHTTVVWNPWSEKSAALKDLGPGEWKNFVCIETTNVTPFAVELEPGESHSMAMIASPKGTRC
jgi:glucose-6-phosphate 1-epimerase